MHNTTLFSWPVVWLFGHSKYTKHPKSPELLRHTHGFKDNGTTLNKEWWWQHSKFLRCLLKKVPVFRPSFYKNEPVWRIGHTAKGSIIDKKRAASWKMLLSSGHLKSTFDFSWSVWDIIWASESASGPMHFYQSVWEIWERLRNVWWQKNNSLKKNPFIGGTWSGWARMGQSRPLDFWLNHMGSFGRLG